MTRKRLVGGIAAVATGASLALLPTAAFADNVKTCSTGQDHFTATQTNSCNGNTSVNQGPVTNSGGNVPPGQNP